MNPESRAVDELLTWSRVTHPEIPEEALDAMLQVYGQLDDAACRQKIGEIQKKLTQLAECMPLLLAIEHCASGPIERQIFCWPGVRIFSAIIQPSRHVVRYDVRALLAMFSSLTDVEYHATAVVVRGLYGVHPVEFELNFRRDDEPWEATN